MVLIGNSSTEKLPDPVLIILREGAKKQLKVSVQFRQLPDLRELSGSTVEGIVQAAGRKIVDGREFDYLSMSFLPKGTEGLCCIIGDIQKIDVYDGQTFQPLYP